MVPYCYSNTQVQEHLRLRYVVYICTTLNPLPVSCASARVVHGSSEERTKHWHVTHGFSCLTTLYTRYIFVNIASYAYSTQQCKPSLYFTHAQLLPKGHSLDRTHCISHIGFIFRKAERKYLAAEGQTAARAQIRRHADKSAARAPTLRYLQLQVTLFERNHRATLIYKKNVKVFIVCRCAKIVNKVCSCHMNSVAMSLSLRSAHKYFSSIALSRQSEVEETLLRPGIPAYRIVRRRANY